MVVVEKEEEEEEQRERGNVEEVERTYRKRKKAFFNMSSWSK